MDVQEFADRLLVAGARNVELYRRKLLHNSGEPAVLLDLRSEGSAALMFLSAGFAVDMGESPDLTLHGFGQTLCAEVKHFRRKPQDGIDEARLKAYGGHLIAYGDTAATEGSSPWDQIVAVAQRKVQQYRVGVPNILVLDSSSPHCVDDSIIPTAINIIDESVESCGNAGLAKLNGVLFIAREFSISAGRNVYFFETRYASAILESPVRETLVKIARWNGGLTSG